MGFSQNWGIEFPVSLSYLKTGEKNFKFLFLFSIGLFGLSSMTGAKVITLDGTFDIAKPTLFVQLFMINVVIDGKFRYAWTTKCQKSYHD